MMDQNKGDKSKEDRLAETLKTDLRLAETIFGSDFSLNETGDIAVVSGEFNLAQAILHRLRTIKGELFDTGHPYYGSTLYDFIGEPNNQFTRERVKLAVRNTLLEEPRIKEILRVNVTAKTLSSYKAKLKDGFEESTSKRVETLSVSELVDAEVAISDPRTILSTVDIEISILPVGSSTPITIAFPFQLEVA